MYSVNGIVMQTNYCEYDRKQNGGERGKGYTFTFEVPMFLAIRWVVTPCCSVVDTLPPSCITIVE